MSHEDARQRPGAFAPRRRLLLLGPAALMLSACAEPFFFHPNRHTYTTRRKLGPAVEDVFFDSDGSQLHGWWMPAAGPARATVVHLHGNAANVSNHAPQVAWLPAAGLNVLTFDYRGFGYSEGRPSLHGVVDDARSAIGEARRRQPGVPIVLLGQSLGGATAIRAAAEESEGDIRLLVSDSAFASYRGIVRDATRQTVLALIAPFAASTLPGSQQDPATAIARLRMPVLLLHGESDRVIPIRHSEQLHAAATASKQFVRIPDGEHLDALVREEIRDRVLTSILAAL